jgi:predicted DNA-binding transcriptional regulator YafY
LTRIESFNVLPQKFRVFILYNEHNYFDEKGFKQGRDWADKNNQECASWFHVKLKLSGRPAMYVKEYRYGENQVITPVDKDTTILECDMQNKRMILTFVLSFGSKAKVIEPLWLKEEVLKEAQAMLNNMKDEESEQEE